MRVSEYAKHLLLSEALLEKLIPPPKDLDWSPYRPERIEKPSRAKSIAFSEAKSKIPRLEHLNQPLQRGFTLHHFANHELMAIELFAWALLAFPEAPRETREDWIRTLKEEQTHLSLYLERMHFFGIEFGDKPLNQLFWKQIPNMLTPEKFTAVMSISFEGANLDFSQIYARTFFHFGDLESASVMLKVYLDEVKHVKRGWNFLFPQNKAQASEWEVYTNLLTFPFTPRRAKAYHFIPETRLEAGFSSKFIFQLNEFKDEYSPKVKNQALGTYFSEESRVWGKTELLNLRNKAALVEYG